MEVELGLEKMGDKGILLEGVEEGGLSASYSFLSTPSCGALLPFLQQVLPSAPAHPEAAWALGTLFLTSTCQRFSSPKVSKGLSDKVP